MVMVRIDVDASLVDGPSPTNTEIMLHCFPRTAVRSTRRSTGALTAGNNANRHAFHARQLITASGLKLARADNTSLRVAE